MCFFCTGWCCCWHAGIVIYLVIWCTPEMTAWSACTIWIRWNHEKCSKSNGLSLMSVENNKNVKVKSRLKYEGGQAKFIHFGCCILLCLKNTYMRLFPTFLNFPCIFTCFPLSNWVVYIPRNVLYFVLLQSPAWEHFICQIISYCSVNDIIIQHPFGIVVYKVAETQIPSKICSQKQP